MEQIREAATPASKSCCPPGSHCLQGSAVNVDGVGDFEGHLAIPEAEYPARLDHRRNAIDEARLVIGDQESVDGLVVGPAAQLLSDRHHDDSAVRPGVEANVLAGLEPGQIDNSGRRV